MKKLSGIFASGQLQYELKHREVLLEKLMDFKRERAIKKSDGEKESSNLNKGQEPKGQEPKD